MDLQMRLGDRAMTAIASAVALPLEARAQRAAVGGVPIDSIDLEEAVARAMSSVRAGSFMQVCTVNLDFLVNARRNGSLRSILTDSQMNLADGAPVVWLGRVRGQPIRCRVAGADFASELMRVAGTHGARVFLLGGENRAAFRAAESLRARHPELDIAGVYEPPRARVEDMDVADILHRLAEAKADILLVALGHPKQEILIHRLRDHLPVSVAVGVGCTFDLLAGDQVRAPRWMQRHGLEWSFRLFHEPRRLFFRYASDACWLMGVLMPTALFERLGAKQL
jgi:N-acetylglucosaminyldiphosphoundecaprenol N-acetyl-beta-D-mannosaminyltransferase